MPIGHECESIKLARKIIAGLDEDFGAMLGLVRNLRNERAFGYARRIIERIRRNKPEANQPDQRLKLAQLHALFT